MEGVRVWWASVVLDRWAGGGSKIYTPGCRSAHQLPPASMKRGPDSTWIYYVDESHDPDKFALVGLGLRVSEWRSAYDAVKQFRSKLWASDGIRNSVEIHARDLVAGRGNIAWERDGTRIPIDRRRRAQIYSSFLALTAALPSLHMINICLDVKGRKDPELDAWDRLFNRINRTAEERNRREHQMRNGLLRRVQRHLEDRNFDRLGARLIPYGAHVMVIADEGRQRDIERMRRKMAVINYVPSRYGSWGNGNKAKNIPLAHFVEDALFRDSSRSHFIQLADCAAFALLKRETKPTENIRKHGIEKLWDLHLRKVRLRLAAEYDPDAIVRR